MGEKLSADMRPREPMRAPGRMLFALALILLASGCAASGAASDKDQQQRGFYGGISAGGTVR